MAKVDIFKTENGRYRLRFVEDDGRIVPLAPGRLSGPRWSGPERKKFNAALDRALERIARDRATDAA